VLPDQPEFNDLVSFYWSSFWELSSTRHELGQIPWTAVNEYAKRWGVDSPEEFDEFLLFIRALDSEFLSTQNNKRQEKLHRTNTTQKKNQKKSKR